MPLKSYNHPVFGSVKCGCILPKEQPKLRFKDYLAVARPSILGTPLVVDYSVKAEAALVQMYLNDTYGDCVPAACEHGAGIFTGNASGSSIIFTNAQTDANYTGMSGGQFNPNAPLIGGQNPTDLGCDPSVALPWWQSNGLLSDGSHKIAGYLGVDSTNPVELRAAIFLFENLFFAMGLPDAWVNPMPSASGFIWDVAGLSDPENGHFVAGVGCNAKGIPISTWAMLGTLTYAAIAKYCAASVNGAVYVVISQDILVKAMNKAPNGLNWNQLQSDFGAF